LSDIPILFSGEMVRGILDGRKTQTRRPVKLIDFKASDTRGYDWQFRDKRTSCWNDMTTERLLERWGPFGVPGATLLWVRETWAAFTTPSHEYGECDLVECAPSEMRDESGFGLWVRKEDLVYHADGKSFPERWRPSIHMPRWASRLTLRVTDVRVERAQDITEEAARAEGFASRDAFAEAWTAIYGAGSWRDNPWVWVVAFEVVR